MKISTVGDGKVVLLSGGGKVFTDIAARFCRSERDLDSIVSSAYDAGIVRNILRSGHLAATEFDYFVFGIEGYSRVTEIQLVRKRLASYLIKSGRVEHNGKRETHLVLPKSLLDKKGLTAEVRNFDSHYTTEPPVFDVSLSQYLELGEKLYTKLCALGIPEEEARYIKPQATEFKAIIGMNAHALLDWFKIRCCMNAQAEIRDLAKKMRALCLEAAPDLFAGSGPNCVALGYCPENDRQHPSCVGKVYTKDEALSILRKEKCD